MVDYSLSAAHTVEELGSDLLSKGWQQWTHSSSSLLPTSSVHQIPQLGCKTINLLLAMFFLLDDKLELLDLLYCIANCIIDFSLSTDLKYFVPPFILKLLDTIYVADRILYVCQLSELFHATSKSRIH